MCKGLGAGVIRGGGMGRQLLVKWPFSRYLAFSSGGYGVAAATCFQFFGAPLKLNTGEKHRLSIY